MRRRRAEQAAWEAEHPEPADLEAYWRDVYPIVREMPVKRVVALTGLTKGEASRIRNGRRAPHRRWWTVLTSPASALPKPHS